MSSAISERHPDMITDVTMADLAARYRRVAQTFTDRTREMTAAAWDLPAPCDGWAARDVVRHLVEWIPDFLAGAGGPALDAGPSVDVDPAGAWAALDAQLHALLDDPAACASTIAHPRAGTHRLDDAIAMFFLGDVLVHTWDLARAGGLDETLDAELVHEMLVGLEPLDEVLRTSGQYGPRVPVPADAAEQVRLIAFTGRQPYPAAAPAAAADGLARDGW
jgi:uncharacterized protein (TIGR03086 family)